MKILLIGILAFVAWSAFSSYYYVCNIKDLCGHVPEIQEVIEPSDALTAEEIETPGEKVTAPEDIKIQFDFDSYNFKTEDKLDSYLELAQIYIKEDAEYQILITGHTDDIGESSYNMRLGKLRANAVSAYLKDHGLASERIVTESKGESEPVASNDTHSGRAENRRVEMTLKLK
jgi:outer membrane protein OmpA-like peptidoglycan-associated protein